MKANANVLRSIDLTVGSLFGIVRTERDSELFVSSSADNGGLFKVNLATSHCECMLSNGSEDLQRIHGICAKMDGTVVMVDMGDRKVKEFKEDVNKVSFGWIWKKQDQRRQRNKRQLFSTDCCLL